MSSIIIIGAGNIGSRHLQAFGKAIEPLKIWVIDPFRKSLDICKFRWNEACGDNKNVEIFFQTDYSNIPKEFDLCIISTNSEHRLLALKEIISRCVCKNILLEKFLFSKKEEYQQAESLIQQVGIKAYVNLVKRTFEAYQFAHKILQTEKSPLAMCVAGNNWGLASNAVHYMDLFSFFTDEEINVCNFESPETVEVLQSKRQGYAEFLGTLTAKTKSGDELEIFCGQGVYDKIKLTLRKMDTNIIIEEFSDVILVHHNNKTEKFAYPFQSQLTLKNFTDFLNNKSNLTVYKAASVTHLRFLDALQKLSDIKNNHQLWKIT